jgi:hypothetical protein
MTHQPASDAMPGVPFVNQDHADGAEFRLPR